MAASTLTITALGYLGLAIAFNVVAQALTKKGVAGMEVVFTGQSLKALITNPLIIAGVSSQFVSTFFYFKVISHADLSLVYPVFMSVTILVIPAAAVFFLGESLTLWRALGIGLVALGVGLLVRA